MDALIVPGWCDRCGASNIMMRRQINSNGVSQLAWRCMECNRWAEVPVKWLRHDIVIPRLERQGASLEDIPVVEDYRGRNTCAVCGSPDVEVHHWAPQALREKFGADWDKYPVAYLCPTHHRLWHAIVTPDITPFIMSVLEKELIHG